MARKSGAGGIILVAVVLGVVTSYVFWRVLRDQAEMNVKNWKSRVVAVNDIPPRTKITRDMLTMDDFPAKHVAEGGFGDVSLVVDRTTQNKVNSHEQVRASDLLQPGQSPTLSFRIPEGMRGIAIGGDEVRFAGTSPQVGDHVDIIATYFDPRTKQDVTRMILQNVLVLMVNRGEDPNVKGAQSSMTLAVRPEQTELLKAAERSGTMSVSLRPTHEDKIVQTTGYDAKLVAQADQESESVTPVFTNEAARSTPVILVQPPAPRPPKETEIKVIRGDAEERSYNVSPQQQQ